MDDVLQIRQIRLQAMNNMEEITLSPKPSYTLEGQSVSWTDYLGQLQKIIDWCDTKLSQSQPYEIHSYGST
ncbi:MAG: hypothetical protein PHE53_02395 [Thermoguttaceae bacterium]|nr:hypothetical protein [Thermoguttaceae bacterium]